MDALSHEFERISNRLLVFSASTTNPERTIRRWREVAPEVDEVVVTGRHRGLHSVMHADRVGAIVDVVVARLGADTSRSASSSPLDAILGDGIETTSGRKDLGDRSRSGSRRDRR